MIATHGSTSFENERETARETERPWERRASGPAAVYALRLLLLICSSTYQFCDRETARPWERRASGPALLL